MNRADGEFNFLKVEAQEQECPYNCEAFTLGFVVRKFGFGERS